MDMLNGLSSYYSGANAYGMDLTATGKSGSAEALEDRLGNTDLSSATDDELMDVCKSFESYFVEQVLKEAKKTVLSDDEDEGEYLEYFGDILVQEYADTLSENGNLGIAQMLYESMKRNGV